MKAMENKRKKKNTKERIREKVRGDGWRKREKERIPKNGTRSKRNFNKRATNRVREGRDWVLNMEK